MGNPAASCTATVTVLTPALTITKTANTATTTPGSVVGYTITIKNTGQTTYTGATVTDSFCGILDDADYNNDANATIGTVSYASPTLTWTGSLAPGVTAVVTYSVTVHNPDTGENLLDNTVASTAIGSTCPPGSASSACTVSVPVLTPGLTIVKSANVATANPGSVVNYQIIVTDSGQTSVLARDRHRQPQRSTRRRHLQQRRRRAQRHVQLRHADAHLVGQPQPRADGHDHLLRDGPGPGDRQPDDDSTRSPRPRRAAPARRAATAPPARSRFQWWRAR